MHPVGAVGLTPWWEPGASRPAAHAQKLITFFVKKCCFVTVLRMTSGYATMVHGRGSNPHRCTTTFGNVEITSLMTS